MSDKVIVVTGHSKLDSGGVGTHLKLLIDELSKKDRLLDVVLGSSLDGKFFHYFVRLFSKIFKYSNLANSIYPIANIYFIKKKLRKSLLKNSKCPKRIVVHTHDRSSTIAAFLLKGEFNLKIVQTIHAPFYQQYEIHPEISRSLVPLYIGGLDLKTVNYADIYIAVDNLQKELIIRDFKNELGNKKIEVISNAVESELLHFSVAKAEEKFFLVSRHLHEKNGVEYAIRAFYLFLNKTGADDIKLYILGQGPLESELRNLVAGLQLGKNVIFMGAQRRSDCIRITAQAMGSIVPSVPVGDYIEATSLSMLESLALKVPLIASNIGGIKQVLESQDAAFLVEPRDPEMIASAMLAIYTNDEKVKVYQENGNSLVRNQYVTEIWSNRIIKCYD
ncbi:TPA: glycosyltransferase family 4 protein [Vibrio vulnificus]|nr:glycosyltransferase [Vibrio vulnificus]HAS6312350.1 glycosyltransferase [Vibrio vulnificus]HDY7562774.1 glycosyltransferase family 4 protein [Vibrio vulnificus]